MAFPAAATVSAPGSPQPAPGPTTPHRPLPQEDVASLLTVVLTTSPTPSAPATDLVAAVLASFRAHCPALLACPVIVVFDTYDRVGPQLRLKKGCVTPVEAANYAAYKANVRRLVQDVWALPGEASHPPETETETGLAEYGSPCIADNAVPFTIMRTGAGGRVAFVEPAARLGFGLAVRTAVRAAATPYVWVQQHDWTLAADVPLAAMLHVMRASEARLAGEAAAQGAGPLAEEQADELAEELAEELALPDDPPSSSESDDDASESSGSDEREPAVEGDQKDASRSPDEELEIDLDSAGSVGMSAASSSSSSFTSTSSPLNPDAAVPVRYICLPSVRMLRYAVSAHVVGFASLRAVTAAFKQDFPTAASPASPPATTTTTTSPSLPLTPLFFWHDKTHIASAAHYLSRVFPSRLALGRGDFIEDHIGQRARSQMKRDPAAWARWACWLYYPDDGRRLCLRHLQGRTWRGEAQEQAIRDRHRERNRSAASAAAAMAVAAAAAKTADGAEDNTKEGDDPVTHGSLDRAWEPMAPYGLEDD